MEEIIRILLTKLGLGINGVIQGNGEFFVNNLMSYLTGFKLVNIDRAFTGKTIIEITNNSIKVYLEYLHDENGHINNLFVRQV